LFEFFPSDGVFDINHDVYPAALAAGRRLFILSDESDWYEIGTPALYLAASLHLLSGGGLADAAERSVEPGIFAAPGVKGLKSAQLEAPVWIGPDSILGVGARLHRCVIGPRCEMQEGAHVEDAVLMAGSRIGRGSRLRGVVTEDGVEVPPSTDLSSQVLVRENGRLAAYSLPPPA
ncbi:MAG: NDP-sugar synthase, partial [Acidobacteriota bacterium]